jgi:hypothetical protein
MTGIRDEKYMKPHYDFKFNQRRPYDIKKVWLFKISFLHLYYY